MSVDKVSFAPFILADYGDSASLLLNDEQMIKKEKIFGVAAEGAQGNGYDWAAVARVVVAEQLSEISAGLQYDPEAGLFCVRGELTALKKLAVEMQKVFQSDVLIQELIGRADLD